MTNIYDVMSNNTIDEILNGRTLGETINQLAESVDRLAKDEVVQARLAKQKREDMMKDLDPEEEVIEEEAPTTIDDDVEADVDKGLEMNDLDNNTSSFVTYEEAEVEDAIGAIYNDLTLDYLKKHVRLAKVEGQILYSSTDFLELLGYKKSSAGSIVRRRISKENVRKRVPNITKNGVKKTYITMVTEEGLLELLNGSKKEKAIIVRKHLNDTMTDTIKSSNSNTLKRKIKNTSHFCDTKINKGDGKICLNSRLNQC